MKRMILEVCCVLVISLASPGALPAAEGQQDLASEVRAVFAAKCTACHGPNLAKPKGRFGYVLDLARVANNREMVVPLSPSESELWELVRRSEMPPEDSPTGALTVHEKNVIQAWIAAGAPTVVSSDGSVGAIHSTESPPPSPQPPEEVAAERTTPSVGGHFLRWLGKFHLLMLHFPIALLVVAAVAESWSVVRASRLPAPTVRFLLLLGATSAVTTAALGWLHALSGYGAGMPRLLALHRWLGTAAGLWAIVTAVYSERDVRCGIRTPTTRAALFAGALLIGLTGHFGGMLTHGEEFLDW